MGAAAGGSGGPTYICDNISVTRGSKTIERTTELDEPSGQVSYAAFVTGELQIQISSSALVPLQGYEFATTFVAAIGSENFYLTDISEPEVKDAEKKVTATFRKRYN